MTVKDLILELLDLPMDSKIYIYDEVRQFHTSLDKDIELDDEKDVILKI
jgi:hypothetical protein